MRLRSIAALAGALLPLSAAAQVPAGGEFLVSSYTLYDQAYPSVAVDAAGNFVVAWEDERADGSSYGVFARRYDASGAPRGPAFVVPTQTQGAQFMPSVAADRGGGFIVTWFATDANALGVYGQRFDPKGARVGGEFRLNTYGYNNQYFPAASFDAARNFVVAWTSRSQDGSDLGIFARRYDASGAALGAEFQVNTYTTFRQTLPRVAHDAAGNFILVWTSIGQDGDSSGAFGRRYDAGGVPIGAEFQANSITASGQDAAAVAMADDGRFVMSWMGPDGFGAGALARRFDRGGNPLGAEFIVNSQTLSQQFFPWVASDAQGDFVVTWTNYTPGVAAFDMTAARFDAGGARRGSDFRVNTFTTGYQYISRYAPAVASDPAGNFVIVWTSTGQDGSGYGIFAQRFGGLVPAGLAIADGGGNDVLEPGEAVDVRPSWRNVNGTAQTFGGTLGALTGPPGPVYATLDGSGSYGTVPDQSVQGCVDCYRVSVSAPPVRPATHWDAVAVETLVPDSQGQRKAWRLHVGDSFSDVPRASGFYRFVETLLHRAVTAGCTPAEYCPAAATNREQMAVFVLVAKEGPGYAPPACGTPAFGDVPAASPYCRWVEELARRGVVSGCGGGNYCPTDAVTREQMAVFVLRTLDPALSPPACTTPVFADVPASSPFCRWIEELARRGVVSGCGGGNYCPAAPVTREQMAVFLGVTFGLPLYGP